MPNFFQNLGKTFRELGTKVKTGVVDLGSKLNRGAKESKSFVRSGLRDIGNRLSSATHTAGLSEISKGVGDVLRDAVALKKGLPKELRVIFDWLPTGRVLDGSLYTADVLGGRKSLSPDRLRLIFPPMQLFMTELDAIETLTSGDKDKIRREVPKLLTQYAVGVFQLSEDLAIVGLA